jgi:hypothetical protein
LHWRQSGVERALRILEVLAYGFNDYGTRASICHLGLFSPENPPRTV